MDAITMNTSRSLYEEINDYIGRNNNNHERAHASFRYGQDNRR